MLKTISELSADEKQQYIYNRRMRKGTIVPVELSQQYALCLIKFQPATESEYAELEAIIKKIRNIQSVEVIIDGVSPDKIPENTELRLAIEAQLRIDDKMQE